jgi:protein SCO1/2
MSTKRASSGSLWWFLGAILLVGIGAVVYLKQSTTGAATLPVLGQVPDARFVAQDGRPLALSDLAGSVWVADLIFTTCSGPCLRMTSQLYQVQEALAGDSGVRLVSISVDPARDTPERLAWYAGQAHADPERWVFLTAPMETVRPLAIEGLKLVVDHNVDGEELGILHSDRLVLVDQALQIRGYYDGLDPAAARTLIQDIRSLLGSS